LDDSVDIVVKLRTN